MIEERPDREREPYPPGEEPDESSEPGRSIGPAGDDRPVPTPSGEYVGRAQPIDPARRQGRRPAPSAADPEQEPTGQDEVLRRPSPGRQVGRAPSARRVRAATARGAVDRVRSADFPVVLRGYDRAAVDAYVAEVAQLVAELEATQLPESVVQRALDEVGDETSAILKRAHEAGEEIAARSRSQAEGRLQRAEREAELTRKEAEEHVRRLEGDIQNVWRERQRLIEDIRTLADDVLALADDAMERIPAPTRGDRDVRTGDATAEGPVGAERPAMLEDATGAESLADGVPPDEEGVDGDEDARPLEPVVGPAGDASEDGEPPDVGPIDEVTAEHRPEDEDTAERPPGAAR